MEDRQSTLLNASDGSLVRQWMELVNEFLGKMCQNTDSKLRLPEDHIHKLRVMKAITEALSGPPASLEIQYRYHCNKCGNDFEMPYILYTGDLHKSDWADVCPKCESRDFSDTTVRSGSQES